jgi:alpha-L-fucosidase
LDKYLDFVRAQVKELCTNYGEIHGFWWDANRLGVVDPSINNMIRSLQPKAVINDRGFDEGDYDLHEREYNNNDGMHKERPLEACQSVGMQSWGYRKNEDFYTNRYLMRSIDKYRANNANYLLNVGPDPAGTIRKKYRDILLQIGDWYNSVKESFEQAKPVSDLTDNPDVYLTARDNILYVHLNQDPRGDAVQLKPITAAPVKAVLLNTGEEVDYEVVLVPSDHQVNKKYLRLKKLPTNALCSTVLVIRLEFDRSLEKYDISG